MVMAITAPHTIEFRAMNTEWWISIRGCEEPSILATARAIVWAAEAAFSRFRPDSLLSCLNRERRVADASVADLVSRALALTEATLGAFDPRVGPALAAAGYDISFEHLADRCPDGWLHIAPPVDLLSVEVTADAVVLSGVGSLDLGGIAKGWTIDRIAEAIEAAGCRDYVIDGGGDIRTGGRGGDGEPWPIGVGDGLVAYLSGEAVATSSTLKRRWTTASGVAHHVIDPRSGEPSTSAVTNAVVVASDATTADALATAVVANPAHALHAVTVLGAGALFEQDGAWLITPGMERWIR
jgi:thiamine biosynthesis lipoprotein